MTIWPTKKLEDVVNFIGGLWVGKKEPLKKIKVLRNTNFRNSGHLDYSNVAEIKVEKKQLQTRILNKGDIILEKSGGGPEQPVGRVVYFNKNEEYSFSNFTCCLRIKNSKEVYPKYLWLFLYSQYLSGTTEKMQKQTTGIRNLMMQDYKSIEIPIPGVGEQRRIIKRIEELFVKIAEAQKLREESKKSASALLQSALNEIFSGPKSKKWKEEELGEICDVVTGSTPKTSIFSYYGDEYLWARPGDLNEAYVSLTEKMLSKEGFNKGGIRKIPAGAVMMCCIGSIGKMGISSQEMATNQQINSFVPHTKKLDGKFLFYSLIYSRKKFIFGASSTTLQIINKSRCEAIKIPFPSISEQKKIVVYLDSLAEKVKELQDLQQKTAKDFKILKKSILAKAFKGQL